MITSDQGNNFVGEWFQTMCGLLGIRQAFSQAYRAQANGRAEKAGQTLLDWLRKMNLEEEINWVEALPIALTQYHDTPGITGYAPYEVVFGRQRNIQGIPIKAPKESEDAVDFFGRMKDLREEIAKKMNNKHDKLLQQLNKGIKEAEVLEVEAEVWVYKPRRVGGYRLEPRWWGPATIVRRVGESSYEVEWEGGKTYLAHRDDLKRVRGEQIEEGREEGEVIEYHQQVEEAER